MDTHGITDCNANVDTYTDANRNADGDAHSIANGNTNPHALADVHANAYRDGDAGAYRETNTHAYPDPTGATGRLARDGEDRLDDCRPGDSTILGVRIWQHHG